METLYVKKKKKKKARKPIFLQVVSISAAFFPSQNPVCISCKHSTKKQKKLKKIKIKICKFDFAQGPVWSLPASIYRDFEHNSGFVAEDSSRPLYFSLLPMGHQTWDPLLFLS